MKLPLTAALLCLALINTTTAATVHVSPIFQGSRNVAELVPPGQFRIVPLGALRVGDQVVIEANATNKVYNDITACFATESEAQGYAARPICRGYVKSKTPLVLRAQADESGNHYLILDNSYAAVIQKSVSARISIRKNLPAEEIEKTRAFFEGVQSQINGTFENSDFNIRVEPCGESNAYSDNRTADITLCTEIIHEVMGQRNIGALLSILFHEYGHSLLNRWGEPGSSEEDMADQFAVAMMLRGGDTGRQLLQGWIQYWSTRDSRAEAVHQLTRSDTHTLSIQRARNIQRDMNYPEEFSRRWNKMFYRHTKRAALEQVIAKPNKSDDVDLAREALRIK